MFTLRQMRYFDALVSTQHFGAAADLVGVSQPALSVQIAEMEKSVGMPLFERMSKGVILTDTGRNFLPVIRSILKQTQYLDELATSYQGPFHGVWRIGIISTLAPYLLPVLLPQLSKAFPDLSVEIIEAKTETLAGRIAVGKLDLIIATEPFPLEGMKSRHLFSDQFYLVTAADDMIYRYGINEPDEIDFERLLLLEEGHCLHDQVRAICKNEHFLSKFGATSLATLLQLVAFNFGITLIPQTAYLTEKCNDRLRIQPFRCKKPKRDITLFWRRRSPRHQDYEKFAEIVIAAATPLLEKANQQVEQNSKASVAMRANPALAVAERQSKRPTLSLNKKTSVLPERG